MTNITQKNLIEIYSDGSSKQPAGALRQGGWGYALLVNGRLFETASGYQEGATNQQMELLAPIRALQEYLGTNPRHLENITFKIYSDSAYLINCYKDKWWVNWESNGWKNSKNQPVLNQELWKQLIPFFECSYIEWIKVPGHSGNLYNEMADDLAQTAADTKIDTHLIHNIDN